MPQKIQEQAKAESDSDPQQTPSEAQAHKPRSRRNRMPLSCTVCRKRKVKCDRGRPHCKVCEKYKVTHLCAYKEPTWANSDVQSVENKVAGNNNTASNIPAISIGSKRPSFSALDSNIDHGIQPHLKRPRLDDQMLTNPYQKYNAFTAPLNYMGNLSAVNHLGSSERTGVAHYKPLESSSRTDNRFSGSSSPGGANHLPSFSKASSNVGLSPESRQSSLRISSSSASASVSRASSKPSNEFQDNNEPVISELQLLKEKIKQIEAQVGGKGISQAQPMPPPRSTTEVQTISNTPSQYGTPLPPIQSWSPFSTTSNNTTSTALPPPPFPLQSANHFRSTSFTSNTRLPLGSPANPQSLNDTRTPNFSLDDPVLRFASFQQQQTGGHLPIPGGIGINPNEIINFYRGYSPMRTSCWKVHNFGPLSWVSIILKDPYLFAVWKTFAEVKKKNFKILVLNHNKPTKTDIEFGDRMRENEGVSDMQPYKEFKEAAFKKSSSDSSKDIPIEMSLNKRDAEAKTVNQILKVLPSKKALWMLVDRFFKYVYPFLPFLDQEGFVHDVERIFCRRTKEEQRIKSIQLEKRLDFAFIGTLLIVLRLSYLSLQMNYEKEDTTPARTETETYLLANPVEMDIISVAQLCLNQFKLLRRSALSIFQCALMMKEYHKLAPEDGCDGFGDGDSQIFTGMLVQMAMSIGINREPSKFDKSMVKQANLWRKIWYRLVSADNFQAFILGNPPLIVDKYYDTELPTFTYESSNNEDMELEKEVIQFIRYRSELEKMLRELTSSILDMKKPPFLSEVISKLAPLHEHLRNEYKSLRHTMTPTNGDHLDNIRKVKRIISFCETISLMHPVYYHLMLHYDSIENSSACKYFLEKSVSLLMEVVSNFTDLIKHSYKFVGTGFDLQLTPILETSMHKTFQLQYGICGRIACLRKELVDKNDPANQKMIDTIDKYLNTTIIVNIETYLQGLTLISGRYFYGWRMSKAQSLLLKLFKEPTEMSELYCKDPIYNFFSDLSVSDIEFLDDLMNSKKFMSSRAEADLMSITPSSTSSFRYQPSKEIDNFWNEIYQKVSADQPRGVNSPLDDTLIGVRPDISGIGSSRTASEINGNFGTSREPNGIMGDDILSNLEFDQFDQLLSSNLMGGEGDFEDYFGYTSFS